MVSYLLPLISCVSWSSRLGRELLLRTIAIIACSACIHTANAGSDRASLFTGSIPSSLGQLKSLQRLYLSGSPKLTGSIPSSFGELKSLQRLDLSSISELTGSIPERLGDLQNLEYLDLSGTKLSGSIPPSLGKLASLETLKISGTNVAGRYPDTLGILKKLKLSGTGLTGQIPSSLSRLSKLVKLDISSNSFSGSIPESLGLLSNLSELWASASQLSGRIPDGFAQGLKNLKRLQLSMNNLTGLPTNMANLSSLQVIRLDNNNITSFDAISGLKTLPGLSTISLSGCKLQGSIPSWFGSINLKEHPELTCEIDLSFNSITGALLNSLGRISNLKHLFLQSNKIQGKLPDSFGKTLPKLRYLELRDNFLTGVPKDLSNMGKGTLYHLGLNYNNLSFQALEGLTTLPQVSFLVLDHSQLTGAIPSWFGKIPMAQDAKDVVSDFAVLSLSSNRITGEIPPELGQLTQLTGLYLDDNALTGAIPPSLANLTSLQRLDLARNRLTGKIPVEFLTLKKLNYLNVAHNQLTGAIPSGEPLIDMDPENFAANPGLCGKPLPPCSPKTLALS
ncbi:probable leucine-rich repeat receptor-like protein kinase At1g35710 [Selaginella moellendorffii]|uniref:probable leucine-rich repeat receptor-like protein kinase At1g35710 n=1 Tax=Selaginella moellendorffii TaxID=88036 RepID=UPI000D1D052D|nr:probable leucine-rich repeat receptor-like protein kinase At1g35710 [Selaginella moellendorffii]|eukprot:XP_024539385.1 probable leucine-rich repeat receptor-like protein kinase At1g35710 [Selaginella moellendorffii]